MVAPTVKKDNTKTQGKNQKKPSPVGEGGNWVAFCDSLDRWGVRFQSFLFYTLFSVFVTTHPSAFGCHLPWQGKALCNIEPNKEGGETPPLQTNIKVTIKLVGATTGRPYNQNIKYRTNPVGTVRPYLLRKLTVLKITGGWYPPLQVNIKTTIKSCRDRAAIFASQIDGPFP